MSDKKIKIINIIFLVFTIIFTIYILFDTLPYMSVDFFDTIFTLGNILYLIGFIILVIYKLTNKNLNTGLKIALTTSILTCVSLILEIIVYKDLKVIPSDFEVSVNLLSLLQIIILSIILYLNLKQIKKPQLGYILLIITFILKIFLLKNYFSVYNCLISVIYMYIALYIFYFNKGISNNNFRNILITIITVSIIIGCFIFSNIFLPIINRSNNIKKIKQIESVSSNVTTITRNFKYKNITNVYYKTPINAKELEKTDFITTFSCNDIILSVYISEFKSSIDSLRNMCETFFVNNREFFIDPQANSICTHIQNNIYLTINLGIAKTYDLTETDLQNLKPFFYIMVR